MKFFSKPLVIRDVNHFTSLFLQYTHAAKYHCCENTNHIIIFLVSFIEVSFLMKRNRNKNALFGRH